MIFLLAASARPTMLPVRFSQQGTLATVCLPALFTLCLIAARAWIDVGHSSSLSIASEEGTSCHNCDAWFRIGACDGGIELETLALAALWRAARAAWSLVLRAIRLDAGDVATTTVTVTSLCSVAFIAFPTFRALEDAEQTYQVRVGLAYHFPIITIQCFFKILKTSNNQQNGYLFTVSPVLTFLSSR